MQVGAWGWSSVCDTLTPHAHSHALTPSHLRALCSPSPSHPYAPPFPLVPPTTQTVISDDQAKLGVVQGPAPRWLGHLLAYLLTWLGPKVGGEDLGGPKVGGEDLGGPTVGDDVLGGPKVGAVVLWFRVQALNPEGSWSVLWS